MLRLPDAGRPAGLMCVRRKGVWAQVTTSRRLQRVADILPSRDHIVAAKRATEPQKEDRDKGESDGDGDEDDAGGTSGDEDASEEGDPSEVPEPRDAAGDDERAPKRQRAQPPLEQRRRKAEQMAPTSTKRAREQQPHESAPARPPESPAAATPPAAAAPPPPRPVAERKSRNRANLTDALSARWTTEHEWSKVVGRVDRLFAALEPSVRVPAHVLNVSARGPTVGQQGRDSRRMRW